jgi:YegS/Rv2252/BmrU family lipid kinase
LSDSHTDALARVTSSPTSRAFAVVNPRSGSCTIADVRGALERHLGSVEIHEVREGDDLTALVVEAVGRGRDPIVAAGGDGTVSAVADALVGTGAHLVILPLGTANVLARELGIPLELNGACELGGCRVRLGSLAGTEHALVAIDAMKVGPRHYFTQVGVGIDALMIRNTSTEQKRRFGRLAYIRSALISLAGFQPRRFTIEVDGRTLTARASQVLVANTGMMGQPGFHWGEQIRADDGQLDLCLIRARSLLDYLGLFWTVLTSRQRWNRKIRYLLASSEITIDTRHPIPVQADGELLGTTPVRVELVPAAVQVVVPVRPSDQAETEARAIPSAHARSSAASGTVKGA